MPLGNGLQSKDNLNIEGSDPSEWEDHSFEERTRAVEEHKSGMETRVGPIDSSENSGIVLYKRHARASEMSVDEHVVVRERPKSLEDLNQKRGGVRAKRESRRMRELEQAIFSLELLKVRATGGASPSEDRQLASEGMRSPQGRSESESSQGSLEMLSHDEAPKSKRAVRLSQEHRMPSGPSSVKLGDGQGIPIRAANRHRTVSDRKRSISSSELPERLGCDSCHTACNLHTREPLISSSLPTFYLPPQDSHSGMGKNFRNKRMEIGDKPLFVEAKETIGLEKAGQSRTSLGERQPPFSVEEGPVLPASEGPSADSVIRRLEKLNVEKEERQKQKQLQNEKEMMEQIRQQKDILERQRRAFEELVRQENEQNRMRESPPKETPLSPSIVNPQKQEKHSRAARPEPKECPALRQGSPPAHVTPKERTVVMSLERQEGQIPAVLQSSGADRLNSQMAAESRDQPARKERFRFPRIPNQTTESASHETGGDNSIFFIPKDVQMDLK